MSALGRPAPKRDHVSRTYWEAVDRGDLLFQECLACGHRQHYPRALCTACGANPAWVTASGRGTVHTYTVVRQNWSPPFDALLPYVVAIVELEEGPRLMTNITGCEPDEVTIGMEVELHVMVDEKGQHLPAFRPRASA